MSTASGSVSNNISGTLLTFTDTGSYGTIISRTLVINDSNGVLLTTINMGANLTATYAITADAYLTFILTVVDNTGTFTATVNYLAYGIYIVSFLTKLANSGCGCTGNFCNVDIAEIFLSEAQNFALFGIGPSSQANITAANVYINIP